MLSTSVVLISTLSSHPPSIWIQIPTHLRVKLNPERVWVGTSDSQKDSEEEERDEFKFVTEKAGEKIFRK